MSGSAIFAPDNQTIEGVFEAARLTGGSICVGFWEGQYEWSIYCSETAVRANRKLWEKQDAILLVSEGLEGFLRWKDGQHEYIGNGYWSPFHDNAKGWTYSPSVKQYLIFKGV